MTVKCLRCGGRGWVWAGELNRRGVREQRAICIRCRGVGYQEEAKSRSAPVPAIPAEQELLQKVDKEWKQAAADALFDILMTQDEFSVNDLRSLAKERGIPEPKNPASWLRTLELGQRDGWCRPTERTVASSEGTTDAGEVRVWEIIPFDEA